MRAGARILLMAADPVNRQILSTMLEHPLEVAPGRTFQVSNGGREMLDIGSAIEHWLWSAPEGPLEYEGEEANRAVVALAQGWSTAVVHALAREPLGFDELHAATDGLSRRALQRQLTSMRQAELAVAFPDGGGRPIHMLSDWARAGVAPLIAAARLERRNPMESMAPIDALDIEAGFRLSLPLIELPEQLSGTCRLAANPREEDDRGEPGGPPAGLTGVTARIDRGRVIDCTTGLVREVDAWAAGTANEWLDTVIEPEAKQVRTGGDRWLTDAVLTALHRALFGMRVH